MKVLAPAKINLYLKILGKRPDGYHEVETLMCPVGLADEIELKSSKSKIELRVEGEKNLEAGRENLVWRAAEAVRQRAKVKKGVKIILHKRIPMGAGLGGGSSDAAAVLTGVNKLWGVGLSDADLGELAAKLGSDVNFFLQSGPATCTGRGERIHPTQLHNLPGAAVLIYPGFGVPSAWAYQTYAKNPQSGAQGKEFQWKASGKDVVLQNDLEPVVFSKHLWIAETKRWLQNHPLVDDALMSGSGSTVFGIVSDKDKAQALAEEASERLGDETWICVTHLNC